MGIHPARDRFAHPLSELQDCSAELSSRNDATTVGCWGQAEAILVLDWCQSSVAATRRGGGTFRLAGAIDSRVRAIASSTSSVDASSVVTSKDDSLPHSNLSEELDALRRRIHDMESLTQSTSSSCLALLDEIQQLAAEAYQENSSDADAGSASGGRRSRKLPEIAELAARAGLLCQMLAAAQRP